MESASSWQLFNTSWNLHRLSPLHHKRDCETLLNNQPALNKYATRLRNQLTGNVVSGLQDTVNAADDDALSKTGALLECTWQSISSTPDDAQSDERASFPGILVTLIYENIAYKAALLADPESEQDSPPGSTFLPLLLTKCPNALRQTIITFLSSSFDTYCAPLRLPSAFVCSGLEKFVEELRSRSDRSTYTEIVEDVIKELQLTLAFSAAIAPALKTLNVGIARASLGDFLREEKNTKRTLQQKLRSPLIPNLTSYLETHLAMRLDLDGSSSNKVARQHVRLSKITCAAFVLGGEGRMKLVVDARARDEDEGSAKDEACMRACETLLRAVISKAVIGDQAT